MINVVIFGVGTTEGGASCIDRSTMRIDSISYKINGLKNKYVTAITGDKDGFIWIIHKNGILKVDPVHFTTENTLIKNEGIYWAFLKHSIYNDSTDNCIYVGAREGFTRFYPRNINQSFYKPKVLLSSLILGTKKVELLDKVDGEVILDNILSKKG